VHDAEKHKFTLACKDLVEKMKKLMQANLPFSNQETMKGTQRNLWIHHNSLVNDIEQYLKEVEEDLKK